MIRIATIPKKYETPFLNLPDLAQPFRSPNQPILLVDVEHIPDVGPTMLVIPMK